MKLITHNGSFHADDLFACSVLALVLEYQNIDYEIIRTRDVDIIKQGDYVFDVGGKYEPDFNRFDHHQKGGAGKRLNGIPYAAFGLIWKHFGLKLCGNQKEVWDLIDKKIVSPIDAIDNGFDISFPKYEGVTDYSASSTFLVYSPTWKEEEHHIDKIFLEQVLKIKDLLKREIKVAQDDLEALFLIKKCYDNSEDKRIIKLKNYFPRYLYQDVLSKLKEPIYVICPSSHSSSFKVEAVKKNPNTMESRKYFPEEWRGFLNTLSMDIEIEKIIGIKGVLFTHQNGFLAELSDEDLAYLFAKKALEA